MNLNTKAINALKPRDSGPYKIADSGANSIQGLHIRVSKGAKTWCYKYRQDGSVKWQSLGQWEDGSGVGLARARELSRDLKAKLANGYDPKAMIVVVQQATFGELLDAYYADCESREVKSLNVMRTYRGRIYNRFRETPAGEVDAALLHEILRPIAMEGKEVMANRVRTHISSAFNWALKQEFSLARDRDLSFGIRTNPTRDIPRLDCERAAQVELTMRNLAAMVTHVHEYNSPTTTAAVRLHAYCGGIRMHDSCHRMWSEYQIVEHEDVEVPCFIIPKDKMGNSRVVPLGKHAVAELEHLRQLTGAAEAIIPARGSRKQPVSTIGIGQCTRKLREKYDAMGDYSSRFVRQLASRELADAGISKLAIDTLHGRRTQKHNPISEKHYFRGAHNLSTTIPVVEAWEQLIDEALAEYQLEFEGVA